MPKKLTDDMFEEHEKALLHLAAMSSIFDDNENIPKKTFKLITRQTHAKLKANTRLYTPDDRVRKMLDRREAALNKAEERRKEIASIPGVKGAVLRFLYGVAYSELTLQEHTTNEKETDNPAEAGKDGTAKAEAEAGQKSAAGKEAGQEDGKPGEAEKEPEYIGDWDDYEILIETEAEEDEDNEFQIL